MRTVLWRTRAAKRIPEGHVAAEFGQAAAARVLLDYGADVSLLDLENDAIALGWAAFFGRPEVVAILLAAGSEPSQRNNNGLTPLGCAVGGTQGRWKKFSNATLEDWQKAADILRSYGGVEGINRISPTSVSTGVKETSATFFQQLTLPDLHQANRELVNRGPFPVYEHKNHGNSLKR